MKNLLKLILIAVPIAFVACASMSNTSPSSSDGSASTGSTPSDNITAALPLIQSAAQVATGAVLNFAVKDSTARTNLANQIWAASSAVYSLSGGSVPTVDQLNSTILSFGGSQSDTQYTQFASALSSIYATYYAKLQGNGALTVKVLEAIAAGAQSGASTYQNVSVASAPATTP